MAFTHYAENKYSLYRNDVSSIDGNTEYFYFTEKGSDKLLMVEYWVDEDDISGYGQYYTIDGEVIDEDDYVKLSEEDINFILNVCREKTNTNK